MQVRAGVPTYVATAWKLLIITKLEGTQFYKNLTYLSRII